MPELLPRQTITGEIKAGNIEHLMLQITNEARHRCTFLLNGVEGKLSVNNSEYVVPVKVEADNQGRKWVTFETNQPGEYSVSFIAKDDATYEAYAVAANMEAPKELWGTLVHPLRDKATKRKKTKLTTPEYGPYASVWGNKEQDPQFNGPKTDPEKYRREGYFHLGHDIEAEEDDLVVAVADGIVVEVEPSGGDWGYHVIVEHNVNGHIFTAVYEHLKEEDRPSLLDAQGNPTEVKAGQPLGKVIKMTEPGEPTHLHLSMHMGKHRKTKEAKANGQIWSSKGAASHEELFADFFNAGDENLYKKGPEGELFREAA